MTDRIEAMDGHPHAHADQVHDHHAHGAHTHGEHGEHGEHGAHAHGEHHPRHDVLVLDIGGDVGALMISTGPGLDEAEIEISPGADPAAPRVHNQVHVRHGGDRVAYTAVFPAVRAGEYTVWHHDGSPYAQVTVRGGEVSLLDGWA